MAENDLHHYNTYLPLYYRRHNRILRSPQLRIHHRLDIKSEFFGGGEALNPSLMASIGPSLTFTIQGTVLAA